MASFVTLPEATAIDRVAWLALLAPVLTVAGMLAGSFLWNEDFWWYLASGKEVLRHGGIPTRDPFLYTSGGAAQQWVLHSWLWTTLVAGLEALGGLPLVVAWHTTLVLALVALVYTTRRVDRWGLTNATFVALFVAVAGPRLCGKAELATYVFVAAYYRFFESERAGSWPTAVRWTLLAGAQVLWAQLHGGHWLGPLLAGSFALGRLAAPAGAADVPSQRPYGELVLPVLLSLVALADPWHFADRLAPFGFVVGARSVQPLGEAGLALITEWRSPYSSGLQQPAFLHLLLTIVGLVAWLRSRRPRSAPRLVFVLAVSALAAGAIRHLALLALAVALTGIDNWAGRVAARGRGLFYRASCGLLATSLILAAAGLRGLRHAVEAGQSAQWTFALNPATTLPGAVAFLRNEGLPGPIFNDFQSGAYLDAALYPVERAFVDGRVLDAGLVARYTRIVDTPGAWQRAEAEFGFRIAVLGNYSRALRSQLGTALRRDPRWRLAYMDALTAVFVRRDPGSASAPVLALGAEGALPPFLRRPGWCSAALPLALARLFLDPREDERLAEYLAILGELGLTREVEKAATAGLAVQPEVAALWRQRCAARLELRLAREALSDCRQAVRLKPHDRSTILLVALALTENGEPAEARDVLTRALQRFPDDPRLLSALRR